MSILGAVALPHPPVILPEVGRGREREIRRTSEACRAAAKRVAAWEPDVLIVCSPHAVCYSDYFHIAPGKGGSGDMSAFGAPRARLEVKYDVETREEIIRLAKREGLDAGTLGERDPNLDHGALVPLYFLREEGALRPVVRLSPSEFSPSENYRLGRCAAAAAENLGRRAVFVASGDLSHKLREDGPYGFAPEGPVFDEKVTAAEADGDFLRFLTLESGFCERAAECGLRPLQIMAGALDGLAVKSELLSYEGPFGVGYAVAVFTVVGNDEKRRFAERYEEEERKRTREKRDAEDAWTRLARLSLETYVRTGKRLARLPEGLPSELTDGTAGVFVSLRKGGRLRGCIGTTGPTQPNVALEIVENAVSAGTRDPRFPPTRPDELDALEYGVDVLGPLEPVSGPEYLDVKRYGVVVSLGSRRGLLLPDLDGVDSVEKQIEIARKKGGIGPDEPYVLERFEVKRRK